MPQFAMRIATPPCQLPRTLCDSSQEKQEVTMAIEYFPRIQQHGRGILILSEKDSYLFCLRALVDSLVF